MKARMTSEPGANGRCLVSPIVVHHQMHVQLRGNIGFDCAQKLQELSAAMAPMQLADVTSPVAISRAAKSVVVPWRS